MFQGTFTALVTPFSKDGSFDEITFRKLIDRQIENGVDGIVPCGTTGESPTLSEQEHMRVIEVAVEQAAGRVKVIAGTGSNSTKEAVERTIKAEKLGVDGSLQIAPYYNKPSERGFYEHFKAIADAVVIPIIIYNVPGRTGKKVEPETILKLAEIKNIVAVKDATGNVYDAMRVIKDAPDGFNVLSGDDALALAMIVLGAKGVISVASNLFPKEISQMINAALLEGNYTKSKEINYKYYEFFNACFYESNPIPIKAMLAMEGFCEEIYRLPLCGPSDDNREKIKNVLNKLR